MASPIVDHLRRRIRTEGPIPFRDFMYEALYHPQFGYYCSARNPMGKDGDFVTSADMDPLFGRLLAKKLTALAAELGLPPESFVVVELGAGRGLLARDILRHARFPYRILELSSPMRERQREALSGFDVEWIDALPTDLEGCVLSNEFFDALPVHRVVRRGGVLREIYVTEDFQELESDPREAIEAPVAEDCVSEVHLDARVWIRSIAASLRRGFHFAIDYGYLEREFYSRPSGTLMCYWRHQPVEDPYIRIGEQDITAHVNFTDLIETGRAASLEPVEFSNQKDLLIQLGILDEMESLALSGAGAAFQRLIGLKKLITPGAMGERFKVLIQKKR